MANNIDVKKVTGDVEQLNTNLKETANIIGALIKEQKLLNKELGKVKGLKESSETVQKAQQNDIKLKKEENNLLITNERLLQAKIKTEQAELRLKQQKAKAVKKEADAYQKLSSKLNETRKKAKALAVQFGTNSKEFKKAQKEVVTLDNKLKKIDSSLGQNQRNVGNYAKSFGKSMLTAGAAMIGLNSIVEITKSLFKTIFLGTQDNIDFFNRKLAGVSAQFDILKDRAATFGDTLVKAFESKEGEEKIGFLTKAIVALSLATGIGSDKVVELSVDMEAARREADLLADANNRLAERELEFIKRQAELTKQRELARLDSKDAEITERQRLVFMEEAASIEDELLQTQLSFQRERLRIESEKLELSISTREDRKRVALIEAEIIQLETKSAKQQRTIGAERLSIIRKIRREEEIIKKQREEENSIENVIGKEIAIGEAELTITQEYVDKKLEAIQKGLDAETAAEQKAADKRAEIRDLAFNAANELGNTLFDLGSNRRDAELASIESSYDKQIQAAEGNTEKQELLARQLAEERKRLDREQAQADKNQALFNIAINTATAITKVMPNPIAMALVAGIGLAQGLVVSAEDIPGFFKGTESAPPGAKWVAEKGSELINMPDGRSFLAEKPMIIDTKGGEQILNHEDTTKALNSALYTDIAVNGNKGIESRLDALLRQQKNLKQVNVNFDKDGMDIHLRQGNSSITYINKKGKR